MDQTSTTTPPAPAEPAGEGQAVDEAQPVGAAAQTELPEQPGFRSRGRMRRRARFLRKARELAYRDLGGLVFNLHRFGQRNDALVIAKLSTLSQIDTELRASETALNEHQPVTVLREAGITACPRCAAIHSGEDHFCPNCGLSVSRQADVPIGTPAPPARPVGRAVAPAVAGTPVARPVPSPAVPQSSSSPAAAPPPASAAAPASAAPKTAKAPSGPPQSPAEQKPNSQPKAPTRAKAQPKAPPSEPATKLESAAVHPPAEVPSADDEPTEILRPSAPGA